MREILSFVFALCLGCGAQESREEAASPEPTEAPAGDVDTPEEQGEPDDEEALSDEEALPQAYGEAELDAMSEDELEAACFQGSHAACDRLGH